MKKALFAFGLLSLFVTALAQQPQRRTGSITGRVVTEDGTPVNGARIFINPIGERTPGPGRNVTLDEEGSFSINNLDARSYRVTGSMPGYVTSGEDESWRVARIGDNVTITLVKGGVITGRVTNQSGEPVIGVTMQATRVKDSAGKPITTLVGSVGGFPAATDDRGVYRIYGLSAGSYLVSTSTGFVGPNGSPYLGTVPVFYPSNTREGATEVQVTPGSEASGIDLRYRAELGHSVSGKVSGAVPGAGGSSMMARGVNVRLMVPGTQQTLAQTFVQTGREQFSFEMKGIANGDYDVSAFYTMPDGSSAASPLRRVAVRNADVGGLDLVLSSLAAIAGKFVVEPSAPLPPEGQTLCVKGRPVGLNEIVLSAQTITPRKTISALPMGFMLGDTAPTEDGIFNVSPLEAGQYQLRINLPGDQWFVKSIVRPAAKPGSTASGLAVQAGEKVTGLVVTLAEGAAQITGKLETKPIAAMRVHLVPADVALANDIMRYAEAPVRADGSFALTHLAPGKYWMITQVANPEGSLDGFVRPLSWDNQARATLRKAAEAAQQTVELSPCMRLSGFKLK